jgi:L-cysteine S-thiosulfotransferase
MKTMNKSHRILGLAVASAAVIAAVGMAAAQSMLPAGVDKVEVAPPSADHPLNPVRSGWTYRTQETQRLQSDDFENPAMLWVEAGESLWNKVDGEAGKSCASCHNEAATSMKTVGASMPKWSEKLGKPINLEMQINECRTEQMKAEAWKFDTEPLKAMTTFVRHQARGVPVKVQSDGPMQPWWEKGKEIYYTRYGQLNLACASCHEQNNGKYLRADYLSQGHTNGFPTYRLKTTGMVSLHSRFFGCIRDVRATPFERLSDEFLALELYVAWRGTGLPVETPAVRQ